MAIRGKTGTGVHTDFEMSKVVGLLYNLLDDFVEERFGEDGDINDAYKATVSEFFDFLEGLQGKTITYSEWGPDEIEVVPDGQDA